MGVLGRYWKKSQMLLKKTVAARMFLGYLEVTGWSLEIVVKLFGSILWRRWSSAS